MNSRMRRFAFASVINTALLVGACSKPPATPQVSDIDVTEHVKTALHQSESLKGFDIEVKTLKGDVRLIGTLDNQAQIDEALRIARASDGAHTIHDELTIKKSQ